MRKFGFILWVGLAAAGSGCSSVSSSGSALPGLVISTPFVDWVNGPIPDRASTTLVRQLAVNQGGQIVHAKVEVVVAHPRPDDLTLTLISPLHTRIPLRVRQTGKDYLVRYTQPLAQLRRERARGVWKLEITDRVDEVQGSLHVWGIDFEITQGPN